MASTRKINFQVTPTNFERILVAVDEDDSTSSQRAFDYAVTMAHAYKIPLGIVTILETRDLSIYDSLQPDVLEAKRTQMNAGIQQYVNLAKDFGVETVSSFTGEGKPGKVIVEETIPQFKPDLLVCGSETTEKNSLFIGSQASYMAQNAPISVTIIR